MKFSVSLLLICFILIGCKGTEGQPISRSYPEGTTSSYSSKIITIEGAFEFDNWNASEFCWVINDKRIKEADIVLVYMRLEPDICVWDFYSDFAFCFNRLNIYDHHFHLMDIQYRVHILKP